MAFRCNPERNQQMFLPPSIEEYVAQDDPVRAYDAFVDTMDWRTLGIVADEHQAGCPAYHPNDDAQDPGLWLLLRDSQLPQARTGVAPQSVVHLDRRGAAAGL